MRIKIGDLVYIKRNQYLNSRHSNEMWLVMGFDHIDGRSGRWRAKNIHNERVVWYKEIMLMKVETDKK